MLAIIPSSSIGPIAYIYTNVTFRMYRLHILLFRDLSQTLIVMLSMHIKCINIHTCIFCLVKIHHDLFIYSVCLLDYEPATLTVQPPPPRTAEGGFIFLYMCLVFPKKCPQKKSSIFRSYSGEKTQKRVFSAHSLKP